MRQRPTRSRALDRCGWLRSRRNAWVQAGAGAALREWTSLRFCGIPVAPEDLWEPRGNMKDCYEAVARGGERVMIPSSGGTRLLRGSNPWPAQSLPSCRHSGYNIFHCIRNPPTTPTPTFFAPTESMNTTSNAQQAAVHWRSLITGATGHGAQMPVALARAVADLGNRTHSHFCFSIVESRNESPQSGQVNT